MRASTFTKRVIIGILGAAVALGAGTPASGAGAAKRPLCAKAKGKTLARSATLRVFFKSRPGDLGTDHVLYGCVKGSRTIRKLDTRQETGTVLDGYAGAKVAGTRFAVVDEIRRADEAPDDEYDDAVVFNVKTGKRRGHIRVFSNAEPVSAYGLTPNGGVAVQTSNRVIVNDAAGRRTVATSASITGFSVTSAMVNWTQDGQPKSVTLSGTAK